MGPYCIAEPLDDQIRKAKWLVLLWSDTLGISRLFVRRTFGPEGTDVLCEAQRLSSEFENVGTAVVIPRLVRIADKDWDSRDELSTFGGGRRAPRRLEGRPSTR